MEFNTPGQNLTYGSFDLSRTPRGTFLSLFLAVSLFGSLFIIFVLVHNVKLRSVQNLLIASMSVVCINDCIFNMALVMGSLVANEWLYGAFMCKVNSFFMNLVLITTLQILTAMSVDKYLSIRFVYKYQTWLSAYRVKSLLAYICLHCFIFSIPILTNSVQSTFIPILGLCIVKGDTSLTFVYITLFICIILPLSALLVIHALMWRLNCQLYGKKSEVVDKNYTQMRNESLGNDGGDNNNSLFLTVVFVLWCILEFPFTVLLYVKQYEYSQHPIHETETEYLWELCAIFLCMRFLFSAVFPCVTFFFKKGIWQSAKGCVLCRRHNSVIDMNSVRSVSKVIGRNESSQNIDKEEPSKTKDKEKSETPCSLTFNVPVLFATSAGICIEDSSGRKSLGELHETTSRTDITELRGKTLDISYKYEYSNELMGDTSDYDSSCEIDQYSSSQPVSTRNVQETHRVRSKSDPEISIHHKNMKIKTKNKDLGVVIISDSGLDLSGTCGSSLDRTSGSLKPKGKGTDSLVVSTLD